MKRILLAVYYVHIFLCCLGPSKASVLPPPGIVAIGTTVNPDKWTEELLHWPPDPKEKAEQHGRRLNPHQLLKYSRITKRKKKPSVQVDRKEYKSDGEEDGEAGMWSIVHRGYRDTRSERAVWKCPADGVSCPEPRLPANRTPVWVGSSHNLVALPGGSKISGPTHPHFKIADL